MLNLLQNLVARIKGKLYSKICKKSEKFVWSSEKKDSGSDRFLSIKIRAKNIGAKGFIWLRQDSRLDRFGLTRLHCISQTIDIQLKSNIIKKLAYNAQGKNFLK